ncbi:hypothetical protein AB0G15_16945 [Streptosporangium sp. NPDC023825]|uniref:right-handed parallel beta-helix repeat-containing protein n=1 Tax=Streptosporangium sp. NPDC023825 TaxID=3154909 RepID=UPI00342CACB8
MHLTQRWRGLRRVAASAILVMVAAVMPGTTAASGATAASVYHVAPNGSDSAAGTQAAPWASIARAQAAAQPGDTVYLRGGTYAYTRANSGCAGQTARVDAITLDKSGAFGNPIRYGAYPGEKPVFDFSRMTDNCRIKGFGVTGSHLHLKGLEVRGVPQNNTLNAESWGIWVSGDNNVFVRAQRVHAGNDDAFRQRRRFQGGGLRRRVRLRRGSDSQFQSVSTSGWDAPRQGDGSLPVPPRLRNIDHLDVNG